MLESLRAEVVRETQDPLGVAYRLTQVLLVEGLFGEHRSRVWPDLARLIQQLIEPEGSVGAVLRRPMRLDRASLIRALDARMRGDQRSALKDLYRCVPMRTSMRCPMSVNGTE